MRTTSVATSYCSPKMPIRVGAKPASTRYSGQDAIMLQSVAAR